jgi:SPP1 family predicted phage head-tail adaptor
MDAGDLRHRIIINYNAQTDRVDSNGVPFPDWQTLATVWAQREGVSGRLFYLAAAIQSEQDITYTIRYRTGIKVMMRIIDGTDTMEIKLPPIDVDGRRKFLEIHARAVLQDGG